MVTPQTPTVDFDHADESVSADDRRREYAEIVDRCPVARVEGHGGFVLVTGYQEIRQIAAARGSFSSADGIFLEPSGLPAIPALEFEGEDHRAWRRVYDDLLNPSAAKSMVPTISEVVDAHIDAFNADGQVDLVEAYTHPVPAVVIGRLVGLDAEQSLISQRLADAAFASIGTEDFAADFGAFADFVMGELSTRRSEPREDFLSRVAAGAYSDLITDDVSAVQFLVALLGGGHHSTASALAGLIHHVLRRVEVKEQLLADPDLVDHAIEESLRLTTPLQFFARTATEDTVVGGCPILAGDRVLLGYGAANRDPGAFEEPHEFSLERPRNRHLAFGAGTHICVGQHLARHELRIGLLRLLERFPDLALDGEPETTGLISEQLFTMRHMSVLYTPTASAP